VQEAVPLGDVGDPGVGEHLPGGVAELTGEEQQRGGSGDRSAGCAGLERQAFGSARASLIASTGAVGTMPAISCGMMQTACMASITIRDVPDEVRDELAARARLSGRSLQEYLRTELERLASRPDPDVLIARSRDRAKRTGTRLTAEQILAHRDHDRR
jgi:antitoxin FitA